MQRDCLIPSFLFLRSAGALLLLAALAACASGSGKPHPAPMQEAAQYQARAARNYATPGDPNDPWGPYIAEASKRFDVPERWIREVMRQESGGQLFTDGQLTTSPVGAMGLMQVMPSTYDMMRDQYGLSDDAYDPHDNILAGVAYMRQMYDLYGSPGFLAAYNAGPARLDDYLTRNRALPAETRHYVASIGPYVRGIYPVARSPVDDYAMNAPLGAAPEEPRYPETAEAPAPHPDTQPVAARVQWAMAEAPPPPSAPPLHPNAPAPHQNRQAHGRPVPPIPPALPVEVAELPDSSRFHSPEPAHGALFFTPPLPLHHDITLVATAMASEPMASEWSDTQPVPHEDQRARGGWSVQVGAFDTLAKARAAAKGAMAHGARIMIGAVMRGHSTLYRARLIDLSRQEASRTCAHTHHDCMVIAPRRS